MAPYFKQGSRLLLIGPSGVGKSQFILKLIKEKKLVSAINVVICTPLNESDLGLQLQEYFGKKRNFEGRLLHHVGIPNITELDSWFPPNQQGQGRLLIFDDCFSELFKNPISLRLFTQLARHRLITTIVTAHSLRLSATHYYKPSLLNATHIILFKSYSAKSEISYLNRQLMLGNQIQLESIYSQATLQKESDPHSYLLINLENDCPNCSRYLTHILKGDKSPNIKNMALFFKTTDPCNCTNCRGNNFCE
jgi:GTPase SAR1 family protein